MRKLAARVILKLKVMYPSFAAKLDDDEELTNLMIDEWSKGLAGITNHDITHALEQVRRSGSDFAPSLPKFIEYCGGRPAIRRAIEYRLTLLIMLGSGSILTISRNTDFSWIILSLMFLAM